MRHWTSTANHVGETQPGFGPALLFLAAAVLLTLMSLAEASAAALPLVAFLAMAGATRSLGLRLCNDLVHAGSTGASRPQHGRATSANRSTVWPAEVPGTKN